MMSCFFPKDLCYSSDEFEDTLGRAMNIDEDIARPLPVLATVLALNTNNSHQAVDPSPIVKKNKRPTKNKKCGKVDKLWHAEPSPYDKGSRMAILVFSPSHGSFHSPNSRCYARLP